MRISAEQVADHARVAAARAAEVARSRAARRIMIVILIVVAVYGAAGFFGGPPLFRHIITHQVAASIARPAAVGTVRFNPYTLRLELDQLRIGDRAGPTPLLDVARLMVKLSWTSLFRLAPVVREVTIDRPDLNVIRIGPQSFNFSDLLESKAPQKPNARPEKPFKFSVSNIMLRDGTIHFDDRVLGQQHTIDHIQLGVPFIANLPRDVDIFVQPLLAMVIDGSAVRISGQSKPFGATRESVIDLDLHRLDLHRYLAYAPVKLPVNIPQGSFSCALQVHFIANDSGPAIAIVGEAALDGLEVRGPDNAPIVSLAHAMATLNDVEPLRGVFKLGRIRVDGLAANLVRTHDGATNLTPILGPEPSGSGAQAARPAVAVNAPLSAGSQPAQGGQREISIDSFTLSGSSIKVTDLSGRRPAVLAITPIHAELQNFDLAGGPPSPIDFGATLSGGGSIEIKGALDYAGRKITTRVSADRIDLAALDDFAAAAMRAKIAGGKLSVDGAVETDFAPGKFDVHANQAGIAIDDFVLATPDGQKPLGWTKLAVSIAKADLSSHSATISEVRSNAIRVLVRRERDGKLNLVSMLAQPAPTSASRSSEQARRHHGRAPPRRIARKSGGEAPHASAPAAQKPWQFTIARIALDNSAARIEDAAAPSSAVLEVAPLNINLSGLSSDLAKPFGANISGTVNRRGSFKISGDIAAAPLNARLRVSTDRLDLSPAGALAANYMNAVIKSARLTMNGAVTLAQRRGEMRVNYRGDASVGDLSILDKLTGQDFLRWRAFTVSRIDADAGGGAPRVRIGAISLTNFYSRIILNRDGKLNLKDVMRSANAAPTSLVEAHPNAAPQPNAPQPSAPGHKLNADISIGRVTLAGGRVNYTDNFIQPNYTANLTDIKGKVGAFGTQASSPAPVELAAQVNGSAPVAISGSVNPLAPMAYVNLKAKADGIELSGLSAYSTRYTGYPIERGTLTVNVSYLLDQGNLTADNHIFIDQLTFGDKVENSTATNLPIRLAVAVLKNPRGEIDLDVPISGSLNDPKFSMGAVILHAFMNVIVKAATSPLRFIGSTLGGGKQDLSFVAFAPGESELTPESKSRLDAVAAALAARPSLKLNITGRADPAVDRDGLREATLMRQIRIQKLKSTGGSPNGLESVQLTPAEYDKYLKRAYSAAKIKKPSDFLGLDKSLPPAQMKSLMLASVDTGAGAMHALADARAAAVRKYLSGKVDPARLFLTASKVDADSASEHAGGSPTNTARVDLSLE